MFWGSNMSSNKPVADKPADSRYNNNMYCTLSYGAVKGANFVPYLTLPNVSRWFSAVSAGFSADCNTVILTYLSSASHIWGKAASIRICGSSFGLQCGLGAAMGSLLWSECQNRESLNFLPLDYQRIVLESVFDKLSTVLWLTLEVDVHVIDVFWSSERSDLLLATCPCGWSVLCRVGRRTLLSHSVDELTGMYRMHCSKEDRQARYDELRMRYGNSDLDTLLNYLRCDADNRSQKDDHGFIGTCFLLL